MCALGRGVPGPGRGREGLGRGARPGRRRSRGREELPAALPRRPPGGCGVTGGRRGRAGKRGGPRGGGSRGRRARAGHLCPPRPAAPRRAGTRIAGRRDTHGDSGTRQDAVASCGGAHGAAARAAVTH